MLSPPSRMWSPTATRVSTRLPASSPTAISDRSVVPPPTSQTSTTSPTSTCLRQSLVAGVDPGIEGGLRLLEQREVFQPGGPGRLDGQFAGHGIERGRHRQDDVLLFQAVVRHVLGDLDSSRPRPGASGSRCWPRAARRGGRSPAPSTAARALADRCRGGTATTWPRRPAASAPGCRSCGQTRRRRNRGPAPRAASGCPPAARWGRAGRETTATAAGPRRCPAAPPAGIVNSVQHARPCLRRRRCRRRRRRCWWCPDRCRRRNETTTRCFSCTVACGQLSLAASGDTYGNSTSAGINTNSSCPSGGGASFNSLTRQP